MGNRISRTSFRMFGVVVGVAALALLVQSRVWNRELTSRRDSPSALRATSAERDAQNDPVDNADSLDRQSAAPTRDDAHESALRSENAGTLTLVDEVFGTPVRGAAQLRSGDWLNTNALGQIAVGPNQTRDIAAVIAAGYLEREFAPHDHPGDTITMRPCSRATLHVMDDESNALPNIRVKWGLTQSLPTADVETVTGPDGMTNVNTAQDLIVRVFDDRRQEEVSAVAMRPGDRATIRLSRARRLLRFHDGRTNEPLSGLALSIVDFTDRGSAPVHRVTDANGQVQMPVSARALSLELRGAEWAFMKEQVPPGWQRWGPFVLRRTEALSCEGDSEPQLIQLEQIPFNFLLFDNESGSRLNGRVDFLFDAKPGQGYYHVNWLNTPAVDGRVRIPVVTEGRTVSTGEFIALRFQGFSTAIVPISSALWQHPVTPLEVGLNRIQQRRIRLRFSDGSMCRWLLKIGPDVQQPPYFRAVSDRDGYFGPFDWPGGDVIAWADLAGRRPGDLNSGETVVARIKAEEFMNRDTVELLMPVATGGIRVAIPHRWTGNIVALDSSGALVHPSNIENRYAVFSGLAPGPCALGPRAWVNDLAQRARLYGYASGFVNVEAATRLDVAWDQRWAAEVPINGQVVVSGLSAGQNASVLKLLPIYATTSIPGFLGLENYDRRLDEHGRYEINVGEPVPDAFLVVIAGDAPAFDGALDRQVIDVVAPGSVVRIGVGGIRCSWSSAVQPNAVTVQWRLVQPTFSLANGERCNPAQLGYSRRWNPHSSVELHNLPVGSVDVTFRSKGGTWKQIVNVEEGRVAQIVVGPAGALIAPVPK